MEIRPLQIGDLFTVSRMLERAGSNIVPSNSNPREAWLLLTESLFEAPELLIAWLADLASKEVKEFEAMPADIMLDITEQLASQEDSEYFFSFIYILGLEGREKLIKLCEILRREYGLAVDKVLFSDFAEMVKKVARRGQKEVEDTLAEAEEFIALAREKRSGF